MILVILMPGFTLAPLDSIAALIKIIQICLTDAEVAKSDAFGIFLILALPNSGSQYSGPSHTTWNVEVYCIILTLVLTIVSKDRFVKIGDCSSPRTLMLLTFVEI